MAVNASHGSPEEATSLDQIDWLNWQPVDRATLLFVFDRADSAPRKSAQQAGVEAPSFEPLTGPDRVLLIEKKRGLGQGLINGPGGRLDPGETAKQAAIREVQEELCITPLTPEWRGEHHFQFRDGYSMHVHIYVSDAWEGTPTETDEAVPVWTRCDAIPYERMWADDAHWIPLLLAGERFSGHYIFDGQKMVDFAITVLDTAALPRG